MARHQIYSRCVKFSYRTSLFSKAAFIISLVNLLAILAPLFIAYRTQGLWLRSDKYREQADVNFKYQFYILLETDRIEAPVICTTFKSLEENVRQYNNCPLIKVREEDKNEDGRNDLLRFEARALLPSSELVQAVSLLLVFDYKLYSHSQFEMESIGYVHTMSPLGGAKLEISCELRIHQKQALAHRGRDTRFNRTVIPEDDFNLAAILEHYVARNVSTRLENVYTTWTRGRALGEPFVVRLVVHYPEDEFTYSPGFWHVVKMAWLQFFALLLPSMAVAGEIKKFIVCNNLVRSNKETPWKKCQ